MLLPARNNRRVQHHCSVCLRFRLQPATAPTAPLPADRVRRCHPFEVVGVDFAGPLYVKTKQGSSKSYLALFTCAETRAIHLDLVLDLTTDSSFLAFQRFMARRGIPTTVYSDNALTFKRAATELQALGKILLKKETQDFFSANRVTWKFIVERAAWWGGWWERLIRTVKQSLRRVLGRQV